MSDKNSSVDNVNDTNGENHLDDLLNDLKKRADYYENELIKRNKTINNLANSLQKLVLKNNEFNIAKSLYRQEIDELNRKLDRLTDDLKYSSLDKNDIIVRIVRENEYLKKLINENDENKRRRIVLENTKSTQTLDELKELNKRNNNNNLERNNNFELINNKNSNFEDDEDIVEIEASSMLFNETIEFKSF